MQYQLAPLFCRPWTLIGITPRLIESHYESNYGSALHRLNAVTDELAALDPGTAPPEIINRLKRDEASALNSTLLHELYFASLGGYPNNKISDTMANALARDFGSVTRWRHEFMALAEGLASGSGWVLLTYLPRDRRLINQTASDHTHSLAGGIPILAIDMYEHAYHLDFGANATAYIAAFMRNIEWSAVEGRYEDAVKVSPPRPREQKEFADLPSVSVEDVKAMIDAGARVQIIDSRPRQYTTRTSAEIMAGAVWRDPELVDEWMGELSKTDPVVTYCVYGFATGCQTALALRKAGFDASYMTSGHYGWKALKGKVRPIEQD